MNKLREQNTLKRKFVSRFLKISEWKDVETYVNILLSFKINSEQSFTKWLSMRSELDSIIEEDKAWLYIQQSCDTKNAELANSFKQFIQEIDEKYASSSNLLDKKLLEYVSSSSYPESYEIFIRGIRKQADIFCEENTILQSNLEIQEQEYAAITGAMTIQYELEDITLQQASNLLKSTNRETRREIFELIWSRRNQDSQKLNELLSKLISERQKMAQNANFPNYLEYRFAQLGRFDYDIRQCEAFHKAAAENVVPLINSIQQIRKQKLKVETLKPYDLDVDPDGKEALMPFSSIKMLLEKTISCFSEISPEFGEFISIMEKNAYLDLDSRKGKAPGGYNYPLYESNIPFIFMNATNNLRDLETMMHEGGHAIHSFLSKDLEFTYFKDIPAEIAEVASMAMELISMEHWHHFFEDEDSLKRAKLSQLEGVISVIPWVATIDKFQHWLYKNPDHSIEERYLTWCELEKELESSVVDWEGFEQYHKILWQKQIHIYQFPLYYIEYGIAQLGAIGIWKNYKENPVKALENYKNALSLGYSKTLPELYETAGIKFDFSSETINELMQFVKKEIELIT